MSEEEMQFDRYPESDFETDESEAEPEEREESSESSRAEQEFQEYGFFRDQVDLYAEEEADTLTREVVAKAPEADQEPTGTLGWFSARRRKIAALALASFVSGAAGYMGKQQVGERGSEIESHLLEQASKTAGETAEQAEVADKSLDESVAKELLASQPMELIKHVDRIADAPYAKEVLLDLVEAHSAEAMPILPAIEGQPYYQEVVDTFVKTNPDFVFYQISAGPDEYIDAYKPQLISGIEASADREVQSWTALALSDLSRRDKRDALGVFQYVYDQNLDFEQLGELLKDEHRMNEARLYTILNGSEAERRGAERELVAQAEKDVTEMNLRKGQGNRFEALRGDSAMEMYMTISLAGDMARPSTAGPMMDMFHRQLKAEGVPAEAFVESLDGYSYHEFVNQASGSHRFDDFLRLASSPEAKDGLIEKFVGDISQGDTGKKITAISEVISGTRDKEIRGKIKLQLEERYGAALASGDTESEIAYGVLSSLFGEEATWLGEKAGEYKIETKPTLETKDMFNERGENVQTYYFYGDEDGHFSFIFFVSGSKEDGYELTDHGTFVELAKEKDGRKIVMYANKPLAGTAGETDLRDLSSYEEMKAAMKLREWLPSVADIPAEHWEDGRPDGVTDMNEYMQESEQKPHMQVHRGHSYWNQETRMQADPEVKLYFDGSCGGADTIDQVLRVASDAQVLYNTDEGKSGINDAIIHSINERLLAGEDIAWSDIRTSSSRQIGEHYDEDKLPDAKRAYSRYVFPDQEKAASALAEIKYKQLLEDSDSV